MAVSHSLTKVIWEEHGSFQYVVVGDGQKIRQERLKELVRSTFQGEPVWFSAGRHRGGLVEEEELAATLEKEFESGIQAITIANEGFTRFVQVQSMGVARSGHRKLTKPSTGRGVTFGPASPGLSRGRAG